MAPTGSACPVRVASGQSRFKPDRTLEGVTDGSAAAPTGAKTPWKAPCATGSALIDVAPSRSLAVLQPVARLVLVHAAVGSPVQPVLDPSMRADDHAKALRRHR